MMMHPSSQSESHHKLEEKEDVSGIRSILAALEDVG